MYMSFQECHILQGVMSVLRKRANRKIVSLQQILSILAGNNGHTLPERMMKIQDDFVND